jgi:hypothetical protein
MREGVLDRSRGVGSRSSFTAHPVGDRRASNTRRRRDPLNSNPRDGYRLARGLMPEKPYKSINAIRTVIQ